MTTRKIRPRQQRKMPMRTSPTLPHDIGPPTVAQDQIPRRIDQIPREDGIAGLGSTGGKRVPAVVGIVVAKGHDADDVVPPRPVGGGLEVLV